MYEPAQLSFHYNAGDDQIYSAQSLAGCVILELMEGCLVCIFLTAHVSVEYSFQLLQGRTLILIQSVLVLKTK